MLITVIGRKSHTIKVKVHAIDCIMPFYNYRSLDGVNVTFYICVPINILNVINLRNTEDLIKDEPFSDVSGVDVTRAACPNKRVVNVRYSTRPAVQHITHINETYSFENVSRGESY